MKMLSSVLIIVGAVLFIYAIIGRFVGGPTVFGYLLAMNPTTVVLGANTLILLGIAALLSGKK
jgi:hypothetical protein